MRTKVNILLLSDSVELYDYLKSFGDRICQTTGEIPMGENAVWVDNYDWVISYNYRFILKKSLLGIRRLRLINMHISYLPYNRGADPNIWSHLEGTPAGITIHEIDAGINTGNVIVQKSILFPKSRMTLKQSYSFLQKEIIALFKENWPRIRTKNYPVYKQANRGTFHQKKDRAKFEIPKGDYNVFPWDIKRVEQNGGNCDKLQ